MASSTPLCGICDYRHISKPAVIWCSECDEKLCTDCRDHHSSAKITRHHTATPIVEYQKLPSNVLNVEQFCEEHDERYVMFCKQHDVPCCITCSLENHKQCQGYIFKIDDVVKNIKVTHIFQETEQILSEMSDNIKKIEKDRTQNLISLDNSKIQIEKEIKEFRVKVNDHLDKLQEDIIKKLNKAEETERKAIQKIVDELGEKEKHINKMQVTLSDIKKYASNLQAYFAMKKIKDDVGQTYITIDTIIASDTVQQKVLSLEIDTAMKDIKSGIKRFGHIAVETQGCNVVITKKKNQQAQFLVPYQARTIDDITLQLQQTLDVDSSEITGCCTLPDGTFVFTCYSSNKLILINADGTYNTTLPTPSLAEYVIYVKYSNSIAVTSGDSLTNCITFIGINSKKVEEVIKLKSNCYGIAEKDDTLFICTDDSIMSLNLKDKSITKFKDFEQVAFYTYIDVFENNLYRTNWNTNTITCYDLGGNVKWKFKDERTIIEPSGINVDNQGNVYVAGYQTSKVVVISPDGQRCREILSSTHKIDRPNAIYYDRSTDNLIVANVKDEQAFVYKVT